MPLSPPSQLNQQHLLTSLDQYIPVTIFSESIQNLNNQSIVEERNLNNSMKNDKDWIKLQTVSNILSSKTENLNNNSGDYIIQQQFTSNFTYQYPSPLPSPPQESNFTTIYPASPSSGVEYNSNNNNFSIKQEFGLLPPSPPDSNGAPSPLNEIKSEPENETEVCIDIESLLNDSFNVFNQPKKLSTTQSPSQINSPSQSPVHITNNQTQQQTPQDHQLLREYLQDTSFQKKHNLKPLALESLLGGWGARGDIEPVFSLALEQIRKDVEDTCAALDIPPGKYIILLLLNSLTL